jgi:serine protease AprX
MRLVAALVLAVTSASVAPASEGQDSGPRRHRKISPRLHWQAPSQNNSGKGSDWVEVIVRYRRQPGVNEQRALRGLGGQVRRALRSSSGVAVRIPLNKLERLADHPDVEFVAGDFPVSMAMDMARPAAGMPAHSDPESGLTGAGVTVAVLDTGVSSNGEINSLLGNLDFVGGANGVFSLLGSVDQNGHGTHVAGIIAADGSQSDGLYRGIAPAASLVSLRVLDGDGRGVTSDVIAGLDWVLANRQAYGIRVVNLSLGHPVYEPAASDPLVQAVEALWDAGVVVVCSAGNRGRSGFGTISSPCNSPKVITVGASNDRNTLDQADDRVASFSSRGPTRLDFVAKPDILAPGNRIVSARSSALPPELVTDPLTGITTSVATLFYEMSGTSMAAPVVTGAAALMIEQDPGLTPATVKARLMASAHKAAAGHPFATGAGALDILGALRAQGTAAEAKSPLVFRDVDQGLLGVENTAVLWGDEAYSLMGLWSSSVQWLPMCAPTDATLWSDAVVWSDASLWPEVGTSSEAVLWPDTTLWGEAVLWPDGPDAASTESEAVLWPDGPDAAAGDEDEDDGEESGPR